MAIGVMHRLWESPLIEDPIEKLVLMALADWSNEDGLSWPSVGAIARRSCQSERNVRNVLRRLEGRGLLTVEVRRGRGNSSIYQINLNAFDGQKTGTCFRFYSPRKPERKTGKTGTENRQNRNDATAPYKEEPSRNRQEPASARAREADRPADGFDEWVERTAQLIETDAACTNRGSAKRREMIAKRGAVDGAEWVEDLVSWIMRAPAAKRQREGLVRFEDALCPDDGGRDRLTYAERLRTRQPRQGSQGETDWAGVG